MCPRSPPAPRTSGRRRRLVVGRDVLDGLGLDVGEVLGHGASSLTVRLELAVASVERLRRALRPVALISVAPPRWRRRHRLRGSAEQLLRGSVHAGDWPHRATRHGDGGQAEQLWRWRREARNCPLDQVLAHAAAFGGSRARRARCRRGVGDRACRRRRRARGTRFREGVRGWLKEPWSSASSTSNRLVDDEAHRPRRRKPTHDDADGAGPARPRRHAEPRVLRSRVVTICPRRLISPATSRGASGTGVTSCCLRTSWTEATETPKRCP